MRCVEWGGLGWGGMCRVWSGGMRGVDKDKGVVGG